MSKITSNWNEHEFRVYLLLYAANADFTLNEEEKEKIQANATQQEYLEISRAFEKANDQERLETILSFREQYFPTDQHIELLLQDVCGILKCDERYNIYERSFFILLKKLLRGN
ncbi:MAG: hypothetical protein IH598_17040 [Bacteroidales bacterium]|nr:hypothetical protein [Bacteroidales bacterium]